MHTALTQTTLNGEKRTKIFSKSLPYICFLFVLILPTFLFSQGDPGFSVFFDEQLGAITIPDSPTLSGGPGKSITVEAWVNPTTTKKDRPIIQKWLDPNFKEWSLTIDGSNTHEVSVGMENNADNFKFKAGTVLEHVWTHIAMTYNANTDYLKIFINGIEQGEIFYAPGMPDTPAPVFIGRHAYNDSVVHNGAVDEVRVWNFAKTASELRNQMHTRLQGNEPGLVGYWPFDEGSGSTTADLSGSGNHGVLRADGPAWVQMSAPLGDDIVIVATPNGGESFEEASTQNITWLASPNIIDVKIEFSADGGSFWNTLVHSWPNSGIFDWTLPNNITANALIRISSVANPGLSDITDVAFSITGIPSPTLSFTDITLSAGTGGPVGPDSTGGHAAVFVDVNSDGLPDLFHSMLLNAPMSDLFFRNAGATVFANEGVLRGIDDFDGGSHGAVFADLDNDGDFDFYEGTTNSAPGVPAVNNLYQNDASGFFTDVTASAGFPVREWPTRSVLAFDMDRDGYLDLFAVTNFQGTDDPPDERNEVYHNNGDMTFSPVDLGDLYTAPVGQGATDTDYDGDGDIDIIAANRTGDVNILNNDGLGNFTLIPPATIGITHQAGDGITMGDIDNDGDLDMMLVGDPNGALYYNDGDGTFTFSRTFTGTEGYMGGFADLDNDGDLDLVFSGDDICFENDGSGNFTAGPAIPVTGINDPRAIAFSDIDNDGDLDFAIGSKRSRNWLVRNNLNGGNWLKVNLVSQQGQIGAFGAKVKVFPAGQIDGQLIGYREARSNNGYLGQNDPTSHFGLGVHTVVDIKVQFLDGSTTTLSNVSSNQEVTISGTSGTVSFTPTEDSYVKVGKPDTNYGDRLTFKVEGGNFSSYLKFNVSGLSGNVISAKIRLLVDDAGQNGGAFYLVSNNFQGSATPWDESTLTFNNAPAISGTKLFELGAVVLAELIDVDVTSAISGDGVYSFGIVGGDSTSKVFYSSKEGLRAPELLIETSDGSVEQYSLTASVSPAGSGAITVAPLKSIYNAGELVNLTATANAGFRFSNWSGDVNSTSQTINLVMVQNRNVIANFLTNAAPIAANDSTTTFEAEAVSIEVLSNDNDSDSELDISTVTLIDLPTGGTAEVINSTGIIRYTPNAGFSGPDSFSYRVSDEYGSVSNEATVVVQVLTLTTTVSSFSTVEDAHVNSESQNMNYGNSSNLQISTNGYSTYLKFQVQGLAGTVERAVIRLTVTRSGAHGGDLYKTRNTFPKSNTSWNENDLMYRNAPVLSGGSLSHVDEVQAGQVVEFDVTDVITADGEFSFCIRAGVCVIPNCYELVEYASKESLTPPELVIETVNVSAPLESKLAAEDDTFELNTLLPEEIELRSNYPNPFNIETSIEYALPEAGQVRIMIYNVRGQVVRDLVNRFDTAGVRRVLWNGRDNYGNVVSSGLYFIGLEIAKTRLTRSMTLQK